MNKNYLFLLTSLAFLSISCVEKTKTKTVNTNNNPYGSCTQQNWYFPGCPGYCQMYPTSQGCSGTTGGTNGSTTSGGTTGTTNNGGVNGGTTGTGATNPYPNYSSNPIYQNWGVQYPGGEPAENCTAAYAPSGVNYTVYETRKATMAIAGKTFYSPASGIANQYTNTSSILKSVNQAKTLFVTDSMLKVRFKPRPQPQNNASDHYCYIPSYTNTSQIAGYWKLQYNVQLVGFKADGSTAQEPLGIFTTTVNTCTQAIDLSPYVSMYPNGLYLIVQSVKGNQAVWPNDYAQFGFKNSNAFMDIRSNDCWVLDVEVAADGTKTFD